MSADRPLPQATRSEPARGIPGPRRFLRGLRRRFVHSILRFRYAEAHEVRLQNSLLLTDLLDHSPAGRQRAAARVELLLMRGWTVQIPSTLLEDSTEQQCLCPHCGRPLAIRAGSTIPRSEGAGSEATLPSSGPVLRQSQGAVEIAAPSSLDSEAPAASAQS